MSEEIIIRKVLYFLSKAETPKEVFLVWSKYKEELKYYKLSINLNYYNKNLFPDGLRDLVKGKDQDFISYYQTGKLYYMDNELLNEMLKDPNSCVKFPIDYSVMLDTNYASYIPYFLKNKGSAVFEKESIYKTIDTLLRNEFQYDYTFYLIENYNNIILKEGGIFNSSIKSHRQMYENLINLELFKSINNEKYCKQNILDFQITEFEAMQRVDDLIYKLYKTTDGKSALKLFLNMHKNLILLLIGIFKIQFNTKENAKNKMKKLFDYTENIVGTYYEREMIIAYKYFKNPKSVSMFNKINKGGDQKKLFRKIENIAWDFMVPRVMEYFSNITTEGRYFIPFFLSHDNNLRELLSLFNIKGIIQDIRNNNLIPFPKILNMEFFEREGFKVDISFFSQESQYKRKLLYERNIKNNFKVLQDEFVKLVNIMS
ncbi:hypothetical protein [Bacillus swezeyi]|uniref:hypothetical protein n=1 Tax=Bacillus swezeyi TaxID=1925020 RepID=UPI003F89D86B